MEQSELLDPDQIVLIWVTRGIEDFFLSFRMSEKVGTLVMTHLSMLWDLKWFAKVIC